MAVKQGLASPDLVTYVESLARDFELWPLPSVKLPPDLVQRLGSDKKRQGEVVNLVLLCEPGKAKVVPFALEEAKNLLASCL
jgi:3-dehydroquinate synthetase